MSPSTLEISIAHHVAVIWMAREKVRNAFNETMIADLAKTFRELGADSDVRAIVLAGRGPAFCAGADLDWMRKIAGYSLAENRIDARKMAEMLRLIYECPKPTIARVHGDAYAGGIGLLSACDIAVAATKAAFCLSETKLGLIPATISPYVLHAMGANAARRYFLTAERFDAAEAYRIGLVHDIALLEQLDARINEMLGALMQASSHAVREAKRLVREIGGRPVDDALLLDTAERIAVVRASDDAKEGIRAFLEKRKPRWLAEFEAEQAQQASDDEEM
jgi:methylglutaconyl-CoA hydratase